jgi:hypothetical protein
MSTKLAKAALVAIAAAAAAPALLFGGAGTAQADGFDGVPEITYRPHPGGLTATVTNWKNGNTHCTYTADGWIVRNVNLSGFGGKQELEFPGVPMFHPWDVNLACDNGGSTHFVYWY